MKRNRPQSLNNTVNPPNIPDKGSKAQPSHDRSPYLKAILSGSTKLITQDNELPLINPDRMAALRYIKDSALLRKLFFDKMSC